MWHLQESQGSNPSECGTFKTMKAHSDAISCDVLLLTWRRVPRLGVTVEDFGLRIRVQVPWGPRKLSTGSGLGVQAKLLEAL